ncbi:EAL domain-containing protein, partial [Klebsiella pneumoniae]
AHIRAVSETRNQLHSFAQLVLDKTERVILQADLARDAAEQYQGQACTPAHQQRMLNIIRGRLYINELIYAKGQRFLCSTVMTPTSPY